ncbi:phosphotransferase [Halobacillus sp. HZG1]|uniref:phosphotransferase family protein n=1 Tax=Halobacillus sp. HZG1 TaxID=3111769 RepID=UPI002DBB5E71|nr:phosphotransferase [Halobacillus sp. HZG1]MEC3883039.1 phosphotransferase [Halobacillus sp. HZG1]
MKILKQRLEEMKWVPIHIENITGAHAGDISRFEIINQNDEKEKYIYKEFAEGRNNEIEVYKKLENYLQPFTKLVKWWESNPQAILMVDLGSPLKDDFMELPLHSKKKSIVSILQRLSYLHSLKIDQTALTLDTHSITYEWSEWAIKQLKLLKARHGWASDWSKLIDYAYQKLKIGEYKVKGPLTLTHGDPHLENVFGYDNEIWFIDWEWVAIGSPLRDITILLQDVYDEELVQYTYRAYKELLDSKKISISNDAYRRDFHHLYVDHTTMMLAWEIDKYFQGYTSEARIKEIVEFKMKEINRVVKEEADISQ